MLRWRCLNCYMWLWQQWFGLCCFFLKEVMWKNTLRWFFFFKWKTNVRFTLQWHNFIGTPWVTGQSKRFHSQCETLTLRPSLPERQRWHLQWWSPPARRSSGFCVRSPWSPPPARPGREAPGTGWAWSAGCLWPGTSGSRTSGAQVCVRKTTGET